MHVHIKVSDRGWILEKMASEMSKRLEYVTYDLEENPDADVQYYLTYSARERRVSRVEVAYFTHAEEDAGARKKFDNTAKAVEQAVCMSKRYADLLASLTRTPIALIPPGVDLAHFNPRVRIGVVGRTYHTGRKGELLVAQVMDVPDIDWHFTGDGWPGPAIHVSANDLPAFYRSMDFILVPSLYEGGPMCVIEALACGVKVIAPPVGWVTDFPHIEYSTGDVQDLRRVLRSVVAERYELRRCVEHQTWERFASLHHELFQHLRSAHKIRSR